MPRSNPASAAVVHGVALRAERFVAASHDIVVCTVKTFGQAGGAFAYGFAPSNSVIGGAPLYPGFAGGRAFATAAGVVTDTYPQPVYASSAVKLPFLLGPPAAADFHDGTFPAGFAGYSSGFTAFAVTPVAGTYTLTVTVPGDSPGAAPAAVKTATAGPTLPNGQRTAPFSSGDTVFAYVVGADYDILALAPPANTQQTPVFPARADITVSALGGIASY